VAVSLKTMKAIDFDFHTKSKDEPFMESSDSSGRMIVYQSAIDSFEELTKGTGQMVTLRPFCTRMPQRRRNC